MDRYFKCAMMGAVGIFFLAAASVVIQFSWQMHRSPNLVLKVEAAVDYVGRAAQNFDKATAVWKNASQEQASLMQKTMPVLVKQLQTNLNSLQKATDTLNITVQATNKDLHGTTMAATNLLTSAKQATDQIPATLDSVNATVGATKDTLESTHKTVLDLDTLVMGPVVTKTLQNIADSTSNIADGTKQADGILKDGKQVADKYVAPKPWYKHIFGYGIAIARVVVCATSKVGCTI